MGGYDSFSPPARVAAPGEEISIDELRMAARNHGMPLEMLAYDVTPVGLHYLLVHTTSRPWTTTPGDSRSAVTSSAR